MAMFDAVAATNSAIVIVKVLNKHFHSKNRSILSKNQRKFFYIDFIVTSTLCKFHKGSKTFVRSSLPFYPQRAQRAKLPARGPLFKRILSRKVHLERNVQSK